MNADVVSQLSRAGFQASELRFSNIECELILALLFVFVESTRSGISPTFLFFFCGDGSGSDSFMGAATRARAFAVAAALPLALFRNPSNRCEMGIATDFTTFGNLYHCSIQFKYDFKSDETLEQTFKCDRKSSRSRTTSLACLGYLRKPRFFCRMLLSFRILLQWMHSKP